MDLTLLIFASFGLGFASSLVLFGRSEEEYKQRINKLERENRELKINYLDNCWKHNSDWRE